jgi:hypothetical protein
MAWVPKSVLQFSAHNRFEQKRFLEKRLVIAEKAIRLPSFLIVSPSFGGLSKCVTRRDAGYAQWIILWA